MALRDVIIGHAKGDKGDKGDTGERGPVGQTGPQGEPGNIADAEITDTQGLDVAKGEKTTAQKLFDAIADRIVNKLVTNDTLTTKLADYLLKSAMSSTNINSTTNVPTSALVYSLLQDVNNNLSKRFATAASGNTYNSVSDFPTTGSGFGVNTQALTLYAGFVIPEYSRICFMNYGGSPDAAISAVSQSGEIYSAFRSSGTWQNGKVSASKDDLTGIIMVRSFQGTSITIAGNASEKVSIPISTPTGYKVVGKISERWNTGPEMYLSQVDLTPTTFTGYAANLRNSEATSVPTINVLFVKS